MLIYAFFFWALALANPRRSPHVGLPVCMRAFNQVPTAQRDRLAVLTGERDRLIGGSADTMYIPGRHREAFMSVLALFLRTNCFLEIAAPTALHLALPPNEEILYVDHVCTMLSHPFPSFLFLPPFPFVGRGGLPVRVNLTRLTFVSFLFVFCLTVLDMAAAFRRGVCARTVGERPRGRYVPFIPLGRVEWDRGCMGATTRTG
jgi:hypothetical protein